MSEVASFHLATFPKRRLFSRLISVPAERWEMSQTDGCSLGKVMGTSRRGTTRISMDIARWAIFAVWEDEEARLRFIESSSVMKRWRKTSSSLTTYLLDPLSARGSWDAFAFADVAKRSTVPSGDIAVLTRAAVRPSRWIPFARSVGTVDDVLQSSPGCTLAVGVGEWPIGEQATFSVWKSTEAIDQFAYRDEAHKEVIRRTFDEEWYGEMLFARFSVTNVKR